jgi:hypothetical protein
MPKKVRTKVKMLEQSSYVLLRWIDEVEDSSYNMLFRDMDTVIKYIINDMNDDQLDGMPELNMSYEEKYNMLKREKVFPLSQKEEMGMYYFKIQDLELTELYN